MAERAETDLVDEAVEGTVHGLDLVLLVLHFHGLKHVFFVEVEVTRGLPEPEIRHMWGVQ